MFFQMLIVFLVGAAIGFVVGFLVKRNNANLFEEQARQLDVRVRIAQAEAERYKKLAEQELAAIKQKLGI